MAMPRAQAQLQQLCLAAALAAIVLAAHVTHATHVTGASTGACTLFSTMSSSAQPALEGLISGAAANLSFVLYKFEDAGVYNTLAAALRANPALTMRIVADEAENEAKSSLAQKLVVAFPKQVTVKLWPGDKLHSKLYIADDSKAMLGSINLTSGGLAVNIETYVLCAQPDTLVRQAAALFAQFWSNADTAKP